MKLFTAIIVLGLAAIVWMNSCIDVAGLDTFDRVTTLSREQGDADLLVWDQLFDQRAWLRAKIVDKHECPDVLILGSSTVGALRQDMFEQHRILNGWLSAPTVEDLEAVTAVLDRASCRPRAIILGVDPWLLNSAFREQRWMSLFDDYIAYQPGRTKLHAEWLSLVRRWSHFKERLNYSTTKLTLQTLYHRWQGATKPTMPHLVHQEPEAFCSTIESQWYIRANDGHYVSCEQFIPKPADVDATATNYVTANTNEILHFRKVDPSRMSRLRRVLGTWAERGSHVVVVAPPYHPLAYAAMRATPPVSKTLDQLDQALSAIEGVQYVDLRDPAAAGCVATEFADGHHGTPACVRKVAARLEQELK